MKKLFILIVLLIAAGALIATNPSREDHVAAVNQVVSSSIEQNLSSNNPCSTLWAKWGRLSVRKWLEMWLTKNLSIAIITYSASLALNTMAKTTT